ncbi:MAG: NADH-quinone oxidoreductase subunit J [Bacteroidetes bacterium]|nr:NADH-quinone oxidoreductase subunit J [Bacteroidota bacterium]MBS1541205.1 NADH-quinone oxidoreductase subunit J [Bacteroidota bacterium]
MLVVFSKNPVYSILYLIITFFSIAGHYVLLNAQFLAAVHVIVYAGAIMVLFLYVIMLLNLNKETEPHKSNLAKIAAVICAGTMMVVLVASLRGASQMMPNSGGNIGLVKNLGKVLFNEFLLPFEISSILLLAAMVGAVMVGKMDHNIPPVANNQKPNDNNN